MIALNPEKSIQSQFLTLSGISWEQFRHIQTAFEGIAGLRLTYCEGVIEIMPLSKTHEFICAILTAYLHIYFVSKRIKFFPSGAYTRTDRVSSRSFL